MLDNKKASKSSKRLSPICVPVSGGRWTTVGLIAASECITSTKSATSFPSLKLLDIL